MSKRSGLRFAALVVLCGMVLSMGCRTRRGADTDVMLPTDMGGTDLALSDRIEDGERITDVKLDTVLFAYDSFQIANTEVAKIEAAAAYLRENARARLVTEGHCDERGSREYNMSLGEQRALAVRAHLIGLGIDAARVQTKSYGEERAANPGHDESAWRVNRRVEFALYR